ncbi:MAG: hypothetical protein AB8C84_03815 [Oligoflexales bacterium]
MKTMIVILGLLSQRLVAKEELTHGSLHQGVYKVVEVKILSAGQHSIVWEAVEKKKEPQDRIQLQAEEAHMDVRVGQVMDLSVVVDKVQGSFVEVMQVHVKFKDGRRVWLLSQTGKKEPLQGESYLQMHAPRSDYQVL